MPKLRYSNKRMGGKSLATAVQARDIVEDYARRGFSMTLRQLYYQFVARGLIANKQSEYKRLGNIVNDARLAGIIDWNHLEDRTRNPVGRSSWAHPRDIIEASAAQFHLNWWENQPVHVEVWIEKEALAGVVQDACYPLDVTSLACRGYMSQSEQWNASQRFLRHIKAGKQIRIIHLGDHDPSGLDMSRDNEERIRDFLHHDLMRAANVPTSTFRQMSDWARENYGCPSIENGPLFQLDRVALNMDQVEEYNPPPNPAKTTDARFAKYEEEFGDESWELDALQPEMLSELISDSVMAYANEDLLDAMKLREQAYRDAIADLLSEHGDMLDVA